MVVAVMGQHSLTGQLNITICCMKKLLELSVFTLSWLMLIMAGLTLLTVLIILYQKRKQHIRINRKH
jgi:surface polysaccharide O-acyltransferase-like enzyme